jgi:adenosine deaminase
MEEPLERFARSLPKAELHLHIEGTLEPEMMFAFAARNGIALPYATVDELRAAYSFTDLQSFLDIYYAGAAVLRTERDFDGLMTAYLRRAGADGVRRAEIFFDPQTHTDRGVGFDVFMPGFLNAIDRCRAELGIDSALIMCFLRHLPVEAAIETFEAAAPYLRRLLGVGLDSSEVGHPPEDFAPVFDRARAAGLHTVAHAGEEGPAAYVWGALDHLGAERIDHGVRAADDDALVARLVDSAVPLTMCPLSNLALGVVARLEDHNLKAMLGRGVKVTINSDDPAYFGGYIHANYVATARALGLSRDDLVRLAANSIEASFAPGADKAAWLAELSTVAGTAQPSDV